jgi:hypothetical protein
MKITSLLNPKILSTAGIIVAAASTPLAGQSVTLTETSGYQSGSGGEFTVKLNGFETAASNAGAIGPINSDSPIQLYQNTGAYNVPLGYSSSAIAGTGSFQTFCVEDDVYFTPSNTYSYSIGNTIQQGTSAAPGTVAAYTTLTAGAAWLYEQFSLGTLAGYDYTPGAGRDASAAILQDTIWALQGESAEGTNTGTAAFNTTASLAQNFALYDLDHNAAFGSGTIDGVFSANDEAGVTTFNQYGVSVLELSSGGTPAQDQLVYWGNPVPDNGTTALLIGASLLGLAVFGRRFRILAHK